jgi:putative addiction module CopG family antidote
MEVKIGSRWEGALKGAVESGRFASIEEIVAEGLRLVFEEEARRDWLKAKIEAAFASGPPVPDEELDAFLDASLGPAA